MNNRWRGTILFIIGVLLAGATPAAEDGIARDGAGACPRIADHQRILNEILTGNYEQALPENCLQLVPGTTVRGPFETRRARYGEGEAQFVLVEVPDGRRLWTRDTWIEFPSQRPYPGIALHRLRSAYESLMGLERQGRALEDLRRDTDPEARGSCEAQSRGYQKRVMALQVQFLRMSGSYVRNLRMAVPDVDACVSCNAGALQYCDLALKRLAPLVRVFGGGGPPVFAGTDGVTDPILIESSRVAPEYPDAARDTGISGDVVMDAVVGRDGTISGGIVVRESPAPNLGFEEAAVEAVRQWRYRPAVKNGRPVAAHATIVVSFGPQQEQRE